MYQALYRKWRPKVFSDVVGQDHITTTLKNEIETGRHSHAYLFTGSRGTGKTTCAKIFAKAVNCEHPVNGDPCNECETCVGIDNGSNLDVVEIDAASNNGVDNIRDIRDEAGYTPANGKYRVYIIDEVHMLSTGAFNALLKTLEEPPKHVKFILATTEVHKLPATILSRCQRFDFRRIKPEDIQSRITYIASNEGVTLQSEAGELISRLADGALRDALSILDQCIGRSHNVTVDTVNEVVGLTGKDVLFSLASNIIEKNTPPALENIDALYNSSCDMEHLCGELIHHFRNLMICKAVTSPDTLIECSSDELSAYIRQAENCSMEQVLYILSVLENALGSMRKGLHRRVEMEMAIIRLCCLESQDTDTVKIKEKVANPESQTSFSDVSKSNIPSGPRKAPKPPWAQEKEEPKKPSKPPWVQDDQFIPENSFNQSDLEDVDLDEELATLRHDESNEILQPAEEDKVPKLKENPKPILKDTGDGKVDEETWLAVTRAVCSSDQAIADMVEKANAYRKGNLILMDPNNSLLEMLLKIESHYMNMEKALLEVFGSGVKLKITDMETIKNEMGDMPKKSSSSNEPDPLEVFISSVEEKGISIKMED